MADGMSDIPQPKEARGKRRRDGVEEADQSKNIRPLGEKERGFSRQVLSDAVVPLPLGVAAADARAAAAAAAPSSKFRARRNVALPGVAARGANVGPDDGPDNDEVLSSNPAARAAVALPGVAAPRANVGLAARGANVGLAAPRANVGPDNDVEFGSKPVAAAAAAAPAAVAAAPAAAVPAVAVAAVPRREVGPGEDFWGQILGPEFPVDDKAEAIEVLKKLAFFDSIHDFWPERKKAAAAVGDEDEDEPVVIDETRLLQVHVKLVESIRAYLGQAKLTSDEKAEGKIDGTISRILRAVTNENVSSTSGIEDRVLAYFKKKYKPFNEPERIITVAEVLRDWKFDDARFKGGDGKSSWPKYSEAIKTLPNAIDIQISGKSIKSLTDAERGTLGFFLLAFMNPDINPGSDANFIFDMAPRDVGKIFARFQQVKNAVLPQIIADSATTSFTSLNGRTRYFRANYTPATGGIDTITQRIRTNAYTREKYILQFVDKGFSEKNKFGFEIQVLSATPPNKLIGTIPFKPGKQQGPSVNYLMDLLSAGDVTQVLLPKGGPPIATLDKLGIFEADLLFDIKRLGDQEQMLVTSAIGITGDRFAAAFRRLLRRAGIFHSIKGLRAWRGRGALSVDDMKVQTRLFRKAQIIEKLNLIAKLMGDAGDDTPLAEEEDGDGIPEGGPLPEAITQLKRMKSKVKKGSESGTVFSNPIAMKGLLTADFIGTRYTEIASTFATYLLRARMKDIAMYIDALKKKVKGLRASLFNVDTAACNIDQPKPSGNVEDCPPKPVPLDEDAALDTLDNFLKTIAELEAMKISFKKWDNGGTAIEKEPIYTNLFTKGNQGRRLIKGASSSFFNFSAGPFLHPESGIAAVVAKLLVLSKARRPEAIAPQINKLLVQYFQARDAIKEAFFDEGTKTMIEELTDIASGLSPAEVVTLGPDKLGLIGAIQRVAEKYEAAAPPPAAIEMAVGGAIQTGGADGSPLQFRDLHDLFLELCGDAMLAIETGNPALAALDDIEAKWVTEVSQLRSTSNEDYESPFEETVATELITFILSFRTLTKPATETSPAISEVIYGSTFDVSPLTTSTVAQPHEIGVRDSVILNDVGGFLLTQTPVEPYILRILKTLGEEIIGDTNKYYSADGWKSIPTAIYAIANIQAAGKESKVPRELKSLLRGGGGLESAEGGDSNAGNTRIGSSRRGLYAGLRKRGGESPDPSV